MEQQNKRWFAFFSKKWRYCILAAMCILLVAIPVVGVLAKYITTRTAEGTVTAALVVVDGDYAQEIKNDGDIVPKIEVSGWGTYGIVLKLYNHNAKKTSDIDMDYNWTATVDGKEINGSGTIAKDSQTGSTEIKIDSKKLIENGAAKGSTVSFELVTAPYAVTIKAIFILTDSNIPDWTLKDNGAYTLLTIYTNDYEGEITVNYGDTIFAPDSTNKLMETWNRTENTGSFTAERFTTYELRFFEEVYAEYTYASSTGSLGEEGYTITITTP